MKNLSDRIKERIGTIPKRLENNGFRYSYYTPINNNVIYSNGKVEIIYDPKKGKVICSRVINEKQNIS